MKLKLKQIQGGLILIFQIMAVTVVSYAEEPIIGSANSHPIYKPLRDIKLSGEAIRVQDLTLKRDAAAFTFKEGIFYFLEPVENQITGAVFIGNGEFRMTPVLKVEKNHLALLTGSPSIKETFSQMVLRFVDNGMTYNEIKTSGSTCSDLSISKARHYFDRTRKLFRKGREYLHTNIAALLLKYNIDLRVLLYITWPAQKGFFHSFFDGKKYGDMIFGIDPLGSPLAAPEQVMLACVGRKNLGIWVAEYLKESYQEGTSNPINNQLLDMVHYDIDVKIQKEYFEAVVNARFKSLVDGVRVIPFNLLPKFRVYEVTDETGEQLSFIQENKKKDADFAIILTQALKKETPYSITFKYRGDDVIEHEGSGNFSLQTHTSWYPICTWGDRTTFRLTLKVKKDLEVVCSGWPGEQKIEGETLISQWKSDIPLWGIGFNYGKFKKSIVKDKISNITIQSYVNQDLPDRIKELNLQRASFFYFDTDQRSEVVRQEARFGVNLFWQLFGPIPYNYIAITPQLQFFGESMPMLAYIPIIAYFDSSLFQMAGLSEVAKFQRFVCAHEVAHQWWGNTVGMKTYRSKWLSEALAVLSESVFAQTAYKKKKFIKFWKDLRSKLLQKNSRGIRPAKAGGLTLGYRLDTGRTGKVADMMLYGKGAFILHMLRRLMWDPKTGDSRFFNMLKDYVKTYYNKDASTRDFKRILEKHITKKMDLDHNGKMNWFFDQWVHGTIIPEYTLKSNVQRVLGGKYNLSCSITQSKVNDSFKMLVPVYLDYGDKLIRLGNILMKGNSTSPQLKLQLPKKPKRVLLCAFEDILCTID